MKIKTVVKAMNFHSLLHINSARTDAEKYLRMEVELSKIIKLIINNRNFILDQHVLEANDNMPPLYICIGSDYSFCGAINANIKNYEFEESDAHKIYIGKKVRSTEENVLLNISKEAFDESDTPVADIIADSIRNRKHSAIRLVYNHYYSGQIKLRKVKVFPILFDGGVFENTDDFAVSGDIDQLLEKLVITYVKYEVRFASVNSYASENVTRLASTSESIKKIDEMMEEQKQRERKLRNEKSFKKVFDSYVKKMSQEESE